MRHVALAALSALPLVLSSGGYCFTPVSPTVEQTEEWIAQELPPGSSEQDVQRFCERHGFGYATLTTTLARGQRRAGGCESTRPMTFVDVTYDDARRVKKVRAWGASLMP